MNAVRAAVAEKDAHIADLTDVASSLVGRCSRRQAEASGSAARGDCQGRRTLCSVRGGCRTEGLEEPPAAPELTSGAHCVARATHQGAARGGERAATPPQTRGTGACRSSEPCRPVGARSSCVADGADVDSVVALVESLPPPAHGRKSGPPAAAARRAPCATARHPSGRPASAGVTMRSRRALCSTDSGIRVRLPRPAAPPIRWCTTSHADDRPV